MFTRLLCSSLLAVAALTGGEAGLQLLIPDAQRLLTRLDAGVCGPFWRTAGLRAWAEADKAWLASLAKTGQVRASASWPGRPGGMVAWDACVSLLLPSGANPVAVPPPLQARSDGPWWLVGLTPSPLRLMVSPRVTGLSGSEDVVATMHAPAWLPLADGDRAAALSRLMTAWNLGGIELTMDFAAAITDRCRAPAAHLPVRSVDAVGLAGLPAGTSVVLAVGVDGKALATQIRDLLQVAGFPPEPIEAVASLRLGVSLAELVEALDGTVCFAQVGEHWLVSLPDSAIITAAVQRWAVSAHVEQDEAIEAAATALVASAREQAVPLPGLGGPLFIRRAHDRLWLADAPQLLDGSGGEELMPFPIDQSWPDQAGAAILARWDAGVAARWLASLLPADGRLASLAGILAGAPSPPGSLIVHGEATGLRSVGRWALGWLAPLGIATVVAAPALAEEQERAGNELASEHMRTIVARASAFAGSHSGHWPRDLDDLRAWAKDLDDGYFASPGRREILKAYRYVQPVFAAPGYQPVLVQDPASQRGRGSLVGQVDGRVTFQAGVRYWQEASRLEALPEARVDGIEPNAWSMLPKTF